MKKNKTSGTDRRTFLKSTGAAVVGSTMAMNLGLSSQAFARKSFNTANILKVGLIGCGGRGTGAAAQALAADPDVVLTAMGDVFLDRLEESYKSLVEVDGKKVKVDSAHKFVGFDAYKKAIWQLQIALAVGFFALLVGLTNYASPASMGMFAVAAGAAMIMSFAAKKEEASEEPK